MNNMQLLLMLILLASPVFGQATEAIKTKDGAAHAASYTEAITENIRPECVDKLAPIVEHLMP